MDKGKNQSQYIGMEQVGKKMYLCVGEESVQIDDYKLTLGSGPAVQLEIKLTLPNVNLARFEFVTSQDLRMPLD